MKMLKNHSLLFDRDCPLCDLYTGGMIKYKMLDEHGRIAFQDIDESKFPTVDFYLARNKIALVNRENGEVVYGVDSLTKVLNHNFPFIGFCMRIKPIYMFWEQVYNFISFNRKIVIPISCNNSASCNPSRSVFWRTFFIIFCALVVNLIVGNYFKQHLSNYYTGNLAWGDLLIFMGQLIFQYIICKLVKEPNIYDYLGHVSFVSLLGAFILQGFHWGLNLLSLLPVQIEFLQIFCYGIVFAWMFMEHRRRLQIADMNGWLSFTWVLYRIIVYPFVFKALT